MKKSFTLLFFVYFLSVQSQEINEIFLFQNGKSAIINLNIKNAFISIDTNGVLLNINELSPTDIILPNINSITYEKDADIDYMDPNFNYSNSKNNGITFYNDFYDYSSGKLKSVYGADFTYYDGFYDHLKGKLKSVEKTDLKYYDNFYSYQTGKIKSIGNIQFTYFDNFYPYKKGKLKSIKGNNNQVRITIIND